MSPVTDGDGGTFFPPLDDLLDLLGLDRVFGISILLETEGQIYTCCSPNEMTLPVNSVATGCDTTAVGFHHQLHV